MKIFRVQAAQSRNNLRIAALQVRNEAVSTKAEQLALAKRHIEMLDYLKGEVDLAVFPESSTLGFDFNKINILTEVTNRLAEDLTGPLCQLFRDAANELKMAIGFGLSMPTANKTTNSFVIVDRQGEAVVVNKNDAPDHLDPLPDTHRSFYLNGRLIGATICRDALDQRIADQLSAAGPDIVIVPQLTIFANFTFKGLIELFKTGILTVNFAMLLGGLSTFFDPSHQLGQDRPVISRHSLSEGDAESCLIVTL